MVTSPIEIIGPVERFCQWQRWTVPVALSDITAKFEEQLNKRGVNAPFKVFVLDASSATDALSLLNAIRQARCRREPMPVLGGRGRTQAAKPRAAWKGAWVLSLCVHPGFRYFIPF